MPNFQTTKLNKQLLETVMHQFFLLINSNFKSVKLGDGNIFLFPNIVDFSIVPQLYGNELPQTEQFINKLQSEALPLIQNHNQNPQAGQPINITDPNTGEQITLYLAAVPEDVSEYKDRIVNKKIINSIPGSGGKAQNAPIAKIIMRIPVIFPENRFYKALRSGIYHELVHIFDPQKQREGERGQASEEYYKDPREILAFFSQIEHEIDDFLIDQYKNLNQDNEKMTEFLNSNKVKSLLNQSQTWNEVRKNFNWKTKRVLKKAIKSFRENWLEKMSTPNIKMKDLFGYEPNQSWWGQNLSN